MDDDKKTDRKRKRFAARLNSSKGITCIDNPSPSIVLCNAGQGTGLEKEELYKIIKEKDSSLPLPKFIAEKGETHSFIVFPNTQNAELFYNTCSGKVKLCENSAPIYMSYVEKVPNTEIVCPHEDPNGLQILNNFISIKEENSFIQLFDWHDESNNLKNRQVTHYGYEFRYGTNDVDLDHPLEVKIPVECDVIWERLKEQGYDLGKPDQLTVNKYSPGHGIPSHVDKHSPFGNTILSLSLGSDVVMDWKHYTGKYVPVLVQARSLLVMQHDARYDWQHGIQPRTYDPVIQLRTTNEPPYRTKVITSDTTQRGTRISLTFRWTRSGPCDCVFKTLCDSTEKITADNLENDLASNLEDLHVHQVYEQIAGHFSTTRHKPWPKVVEFMSEVPTGSVVLDLGAGNGKNVLLRNDIIQLACERSAGLLAACSKHVRGVSGAGLVRLDILQAGVRDSCADVIVCIAVIHHFSTEARRLQSIATIHRLLRTGGKALITVWAKDQTKSNYLSQSKQEKSTHDHTEQQITIGGVSLPVHENRTQFKHQDLLVPWKLRKITQNKLSDQPENTLLRYYHVFEQNELDELCKKVGFQVENSFYEEGNWCVVCKKNK